MYADCVGTEEETGRSVAKAVMARNDAGESRIHDEHGILGP